MDSHHQFSKYITLQITSTSFWWEFLSSTLLVSFKYSMQCYQLLSPYYTLDLQDISIYKWNFVPFYPLLHTYPILQQMGNILLSVSMSSTLKNIISIIYIIDIIQYLSFSFWFILLIIPSVLSHPCCHKWQDFIY